MIGNNVITLVNFHSDWIRGWKFNSDDSKARLIRIKNLVRFRQDESIPLIQIDFQWIYSERGSGHFSDWFGNRFRNCSESFGLSSVPKLAKSNVMQQCDYFREFSFRLHSWSKWFGLKIQFRWFQGRIDSDWKLSSDLLGWKYPIDSNRFPIDLKRTTFRTFFGLVRKEISKWLRFARIEFRVKTSQGQCNATVWFLL